MVDLFKQLTEFDAYPFQQETSSKLLNGQNVILSAPTGAGKTYAALLPFFWAKFNKQTFVDKLIYALPLRTLATSLYTDTLRLNENKAIKSLGMKITIQTGEQKNDPFFEGDIIFTTIDQLLSGYLNIPASLPLRLSNINSGALIGTIIVFDEFHLLEADKSMGTAIELMDRLNPVSKFLLMTATMSHKSCDWLADKIKAERIVLKEPEVKIIQGKFKQGRQTRNWTWLESAMTADNILKAHQTRSIVLCNTVKRAQHIYNRLKEAIKSKNGETEIVLLHSRFFPEDRKVKEAAIEIFSKEAQDEPANVILVTTQVIEAGIDISAENLHTEIAPMNSLIQRAGRCARYGGDGNIWVYELEHPQNTKPYTTELVEATRTALKQSLPETINFFDEQALVDKVHVGAEINALSQYNNLNNIRGKVLKAIEEGGANRLSELIREVNNVSLLITDIPETVSFNKTNWPLTLSVPRSSIWGLKSCLENITDGRWVVKLPHDDSSKEEAGLHFKWEPAADVNTVVNTSWLIAIHPDYARYSENVGLELGQSGAAPGISYQDRPQTPAYHYQCETWLQHTEQLIDQSKNLLARMPAALAKLSHLYNLTEEQLQETALLSCALHDTGKLSVQWQQAAKNWQNDHYPGDYTTSKGQPLAHTTYNPELDWHKQLAGGRKYNRGPHAAEGAFALAKYLSYHYNKFADGDNSSLLTILILSAITRHHGGRVSQLSDFRLLSDAHAWIGEALKQIGEFSGTPHLLDNPDTPTKEQFQRMLINFTDADWNKWIPLYFWLVRIIRLADQKGTAAHSGGTKENV